MKYVLDNDISFRFARMLAALGVDVEAIRDEFHAEVKDPVFLKEFKGRDMVFISHNTKQTTNPIEAKLLKQANITALYLAPSGQRWVSGLRPHGSLSTGLQSTDLRGVQRKAPAQRLNKVESQ